MVPKTDCHRLPEGTDSGFQGNGGALTKNPGFGCHSERSEELRPRSEVFSQGDP
jgi:hypothetical protein